MIDLIGSQEPRIELIPEGDEHPRWSEVVDFIKALGIVLDPWQLRVLWTSLLRRDGLWAAFAVAVCAPRQNGKNGILEIRELIGPLLLDEKLVIHSAHLADTSKEGFRRLDDLIDANEWLSAKVKHVWRTNGHESIEFTNGNRIRFRTRTRGGGRGFSGTPVIFDEPMFLPEISMGSVLPVISAQPDPQVWYTGSAVDQTLHEDGIAFARVRARALAGDDDRLAYFEWSLDAKNPDEVDMDVAENPDVWAATNPALGIRINPEYVDAERRELDPRTFAVERLGVGDWPDITAERGLFDMLRWRGLLTDTEATEATLALDVSPMRTWASIVSAKRSGGEVHLTVVDRQAGTGWIVERLVELMDELRPERIVCDERGPAASLLPELEEAGLEIETIDTLEYTRGCGMFFDAYDQGTVRHDGNAALEAAIRGAAQRTLADAWAWSRKHSRADITPLVAATIAHRAEATAKDDRKFVGVAFA